MYNRWLLAIYMKIFMHKQQRKRQNSSLYYRRYCQRRYFHHIIIKEEEGEKWEMPTKILSWTMDGFYAGAWRIFITASFRAERKPKVKTLCYMHAHAHDIKPAYISRNRQPHQQIAKQLRRQDFHYCSRWQKIANISVDSDVKNMSLPVLYLYCAECKIHLYGLFIFFYNIRSCFIFFAVTYYHRLNRHYALYACVNNIEKW